MALVILFPEDPLSSCKIDSAFEYEAETARKVGCFIGAIDIDSDPLDEDLEADRIGEPAIYRGWMMTPLRYQWLYEALWERGFRLINSPEEYRYCHELPRWYSDFEGATPKSVWGGEAIGLTPPEWDYAYVQASLGEGPLIVKDYVKSRKHEWDEACFIPGGLEALERVTKRFIELQGKDLAGGVVHRQFAPLARVGKHPKSGMPIYNEARLWFLGGTLLAAHPYWGPDEGGDAIRMPSRPWGDTRTLKECWGSVPLHNGRTLAEYPAKSNFYTVDIAYSSEGDWWVIELGDGQVSGLPLHVDVEAFYRGLRDRFSFH